MITMIFQEDLLLIGIFKRKRHKYLFIKKLYATFEINTNNIIYDSIHLAFCQYFRRFGFGFVYRLKPIFHF